MHYRLPTIDYRLSPIVARHNYCRAYPCLLVREHNFSSARNRNSQPFRASPRLNKWATKGVVSPGNPESKGGSSVHFQECAGTAAAPAWISRLWICLPGSLPRGRALGTRVLRRGVLQRGYRPSSSRRGALARAASTRFIAKRVASPRDSALPLTALAHSLLRSFPGRWARPLPKPKIRIG